MYNFADDMRSAFLFVSILLVELLLAGCQKREELPECNAVYYWRTELRLDTAERAFLQQYHINKVYCRYFDVVMQPTTADGDSLEPMPNATIAFSDTLPEGVEIVPTVYITEDCMHKWHEGLAEKIVKRILQMNETNDIGSVREIQIDCDYTSRSRKVYYEFLEEVHSQLSIANAQLSTTIRLHQLQMAPPPADYGVLMLYNTGDPRKFAERNPVLDLRDVQPYVRYLDDYDLPLAAAYPVYCWQRTIHNVHIEHTVEADEILRVKQAVERERSDLSRTVVTYHLDKENIGRYTPETYEEIYEH
jgi:hypothetical protein